MKARKDLDRMKSIATKLKNPSDSIAKFIEPTAQAKMQQREKSSNLQAQKVPSFEHRPITSEGAPLSDEQKAKLKENMERRQAGKAAKKEAVANYDVINEVNEQMADDKNLIADANMEDDEGLVIEDIV
jgi:hypothetical protein